MGHSLITDENLWFLQSGSDLKIDRLGTNTSVTVSNWLSGGLNQLQEITAGGLKIDSQILHLVQAIGELFRKQLRVRSDEFKRHNRPE